MERVLIVTVNWLGDAIMTTPAARAIKEEFPSLYLAVLAPGRVAAVFENNPYIDEVIRFNDKAFKKSFLKKISLIKVLRKKKFDTAFLIHRSFSRALICWAAGIKQRIGYRRLKNFLVITDPIRPPANPLHRQDYYLYIFEKAGIRISERLPAVFISRAAVKKTNRFLKGIRKKHKIIIGINPSANWKLKRWPADNFAYVADKLIEEFKCAVLFIGTNKDNQTVENVLKHMHHTSYNMCGKTSVSDLAALMKNFSLFLSNDSGPAHLSASLNIPTFVLFGPTSSQLTAPRSRAVKIICSDVPNPAKCKIPCYNLKCKDNICMKNISADHVLTQIRNELHKKQV